MILASFEPAQLLYYESRSVPEKYSGGLMRCSIKVNSYEMQALVDTRAAVSVIRHRVCQKYGTPIETDETKLLCGFNSSTARTKGITTIDVTTGNRHCNNPFHMIGIGSQILILGNDFFIDKGVILYQKKVFQRSN